MNCCVEALYQVVSVHVYNIWLKSIADPRITIGMG